MKYSHFPSNKLYTINQSSSLFEINHNLFKFTKALLHRAYCFPEILAYESRNVTVRLKTRRSSVLSVSTQKYPVNRKKKSSFYMYATIDSFYVMMKSNRIDLFTSCLDEHKVDFLYD